MKKNFQELLNYIQLNPLSSSKKIHEELGIKIGYATVKRILTKLHADSLIEKIGKGRGTKYKLSETYDLFKPIDVEKYFNKEIDEREIKEFFNLDLIPNILSKINLFTLDEKN